MKEIWVQFCVSMVQGEGNVVYSDVYQSYSVGNVTVQLSVVGFGLECV